MQIVNGVVIVLAIVLGPRLMVLLSSRVKVLGYLGPVFLCYALGFILSLVLTDTSLAMSIAEILVPVAIPLILFSVDLKSVKRLAKPMLISFLLMMAAVCAMAVIAALVFNTTIADVYKYSGMMIGLYTGGTPNLMAIGVALSVPDTQIVLANTADVVVGGIYFLLLISFMPRLCRRFLGDFKLGGNSADAALADNMEESFVPEKEPFSFKSILRRVPIVLLGVASLAVAAGLALLITGTLNVVVIMLAVTSCGVGLSFVKKVREAPGSFAAGQYIILMFSVGIGLSFDFDAINSGSLMFLALFATVQFGTIILHILLGKLCRLDGDTVLITSTAGIYGPAFIVPAANAMKNRQVVLPGLICGILGYAVGNYLGIGAAYLIRLLI